MATVGVGVMEREESFVGGDLLKPGPGVTSGLHLQKFTRIYAYGFFAHFKIKH